MDTAEIGTRLGETELCLLELMWRLYREGYQFVTPTPATHRRVAGRPLQDRPGLRDVFGWSRAFAERDLPADILELMRRGDVLEETADGLRSRLRLSSLAGGLFWHSAFPANEADAVFFGPDTYRYADLLRRELPALEAGALVVDVGAGSGAGGLMVKGLAPQAKVTLSDTNPRALSLARVNAAFAGREVELVEAEGLEGVDGEFDLVVANPPYIAGSGKTYSDGGDGLGAAISVDWARAAMRRLAPGGRLILYTGSAIVAGRDALAEALAREAGDAGCRLAYREIDPDVFGEVLNQRAYREVERICVVAAVADKPSEGTR